MRPFPGRDWLRGVDRDDQLVLRAPVLLPGVLQWLFQGAPVVLLAQKDLLQGPYHQMNLVVGLSVSLREARLEALVVGQSHFQRIASDLHRRS